MKLTLHALSKALSGRDLFTDFSLEIQTGVRLCVCGPNGAGKSTFIRMLAGEEPPDSGKTLLPKAARVGYVAQEFAAQALETPLLSWVLAALPDWSAFWKEWEAATARRDAAALRALSVRQAELEVSHGYNPEHRARAVLFGLGFTEEKLSLPLARLSGGWRERAKLARVLTAGADILLLDEPTNHLDLDAVEWLESFLLEYKGILVFVAHDRVFMDRIATHVLCLGGGKPVLQRGGFSRFVETQAALEEQRERAAKHLAQEVERKMEFVRRFKAKATKARQAASRQKMALRLERELEAVRPGPRRRELAFQWPAPAPSDKLALNVTGLSYAFADGKRLFHDLDFQLYRGRKIGLVGPNGCGKTTLLKILARKLEPVHGSVLWGPLTRLGYFSQHQMEILAADGTALGEIRRLSDPRTTEEELMSALGLFMLGQEFFDRPVRTLSGGEKGRLMLAVLFLSRSNVLILDEPTNHLDLESRQALMDALDQFPGAVLMVAHDRALLSAAADEIWSLEPGGLRVYENGYAEYAAARQQARRAEAQAASGPADKEELRRQRREKAEQRNALSRRMRPYREASAAKEQELAQTMAEQDDAEAQLADPEAYAAPGRAAELLKRRHAAQQRCEALIAELEELERALAALEAEKALLAGEDAP